MTPSRVVKLAGDGRIDGAKLVGHSWLFPSDTAPLPDKRRRENRAAVIRSEFRFPLYFYCVLSKEELTRFTENERTLYEAEQAYLRRGYSECISTLEVLTAKTADIPVRIGSLYILCMSYLCRHMFSRAAHCFFEMQTILEADIPNRQVLMLILHDLESYFTGNSFYIDGFTLELEAEYPQQLRDYFMLQIAFSEVMKTSFRRSAPDPLPFALFCVSERQRLSPLTAALIQLYTALIYIGAGNDKQAAVFLRESCLTAGKHGLEHLIAFAVHYVPELFRAVLKDENPELLARIEQCSQEERALFNALHEYLDRHDILPMLNREDSKYVMYARQGLTNKEISAILGLSVNTISKKYSALFEKTGVHSKGELVRLYVDAMKEY